jgi:dihydroorotase
LTGVTNEKMPEEKSSKVLIKNGLVVNEGRSEIKDVLIEGQRIERVEQHISPRTNEKVIDASGMWVLPGLIDDQVHFREPGLTHKAEIATESRAAVAGGITSYIEQPNTRPPALTAEAVEEKYARAAECSMANFGFNIGASNENLEELKRLEKGRFPGVKVFMGSSTGNMLVDNEQMLEGLFGELDQLIITHCEDETTIQNNLEAARQRFGADIPMDWHSRIRSEEACYLSSSRAVEMARKKGARLHVYHLSTEKETALFDKGPIEGKKITAEACVHHLWFTDNDYAAKGSLIKWNPAVKTEKDRAGLWKALLDDRIDVIATDHAPHLLEEKKQPYEKAPSGGPLVQHFLPAMLEFVRQDKIKIEWLVQRICHNPATLFRIQDRGYIRPGYYADLVLVEPSAPWTVTSENTLYKCGWSPFEGTSFKSRVDRTLVNGRVVYDKGRFEKSPMGMRLTHHAD